MMKALRPAIAYRIPRLALRPQSFVNPTPVYWMRPMSTTGSGPNVEEAINNIEELFGAAKDEMEFAVESQGSVYYHEDRATAQKAVEECLDAFDKLLEELPDDTARDQVRGKIGMKLRELKMEYESLPEEGD